MKISPLTKTICHPFSHYLLYYYNIYPIRFYSSFKPNFRLIFHSLYQFILQLALLSIRSFQIDFLINFFSYSFRNLISAFLDFFCKFLTNLLFILLDFKRVFLLKDGLSNFYFLKHDLFLYLKYYSDFLSEFLNGIFMLICSLYHLFSLLF